MKHVEKNRFHIFDVQCTCCSFTYSSIYLICVWMNMATHNIVQCAQSIWLTITKPKWCWLFSDDDDMSAIKEKYKSCRQCSAWYLSFFYVAWHDKFKLNGSANFLFHFSVGFEEISKLNIVSQCLLHSIDWKSSTFNMPFYYFSSHHHNMKCCLGMCRLKIAPSKWAVYPVWTQNNL